MVTRTFDFLFDVAGPNGYLVHRVLPEFCERTGSTANYVPVLLGGMMKATGNRPPWMVYSDVPAKLAYDQLEFSRFIEKHSLSRFRMNPNFPINSLPIMRAIVAARGMGRLAEAVEAMMVAMWEEERNLSEPDAILKAFADAGLDGERLMALGQDEAVKSELAANTERAVARGAFGIPTFFIGKEMWFGKERLGQVEAALAAA